MSGLFFSLPLPPPVGPAELDIDVPFIVDRQEQSQWCWAAMGASLERAFGSGPEMRQCDVVNGRLGFPICCDEQMAASSTCNQSWVFESALDNLPSLGVERIPVFPSMDSIIQELGRGPLIAIVRFPGINHCLAIIGAAAETPFMPAMLRLSDPDCGESDVTLAMLKTAYRSAGKWKQTYRVRSKL